MAYYQLWAGKLGSVLLKQKKKLVEYLDAEKGITLLYRLKLQNAIHQFFHRRTLPQIFPFPEPNLTKNGICTIRFFNKTSCIS